MDNPLPSVPEITDLQRLLNLFNQGDFGSAEHHARDLVARFPSHGFAWKILGMSLKQRGQSTDSLLSMQKAAELLPDDTEVHFNLGVNLMSHGQAAEATLSFKRAVELNPNYGDTLHKLGLTLMSQGKYQKAADCFRQVLALDNNNPEAHFNLGRMFQELGQLPEAEHCYRHVIQNYPELTDVHGDLAWILHWQGRYDEATVSYQQALASNPQDAKAHGNFGLLLQTQGRLLDAKQCYQNALAINSEYAEIHNNLGIVFHELGLNQEAESCYQRALAIKPDFAEAYNNLGLSLQALGHLDQAETAYRNALSIQTNNSQVYNNLGIVFQARGQLIEAQACYQRALSIHPDDAQLHNNLGAVYQDSGNTLQAEFSFRRALAINPDFTEARSNLLYVINYYSSYMTADYMTEAKLYGQTVKVKDEIYTRWLCTDPPERLRVGMVLGDLTHHALGHFLNNLLPELDHDSVEPIAYFTHAKTDELTARIQKHCTASSTLVGLNDAEAAKLIHDDGVHVLLDLTGHSHYNRLPVFAYKPAPIQASWLGYLASTGVSEMDYILGDPYVTPPQDSQHFSEKIWQLPESYCCFNTPEFDVAVNPLPALNASHTTFGCFESIKHINNTVIGLWAQILNAVPYSRLLIKNEQLDNPLSRQTLYQRFAEHGILPERLLLEGISSAQEKLTAYHHIDIALSTFPYSDTSNTLQALWMGVPVISKAGDRFITRCNDSILANTDLSVWIAEDEADYLTKAVYFSWDVATLAELRATLRQQITDSPLFDTTSFARNFEAALWSMYLD